MLDIMGKFLLKLMILESFPSDDDDDDEALESEDQS